MTPDEVAAEVERLTLLRAADARSRDELSAALAEAQRREELMRPVVEAARAWRRDRTPERVQALEDAIDTDDWRRTDG